MSTPLRKGAWFVAIWLMSVATLGVIAYAIRLVLYG